MRRFLHIIPLIVLLTTSLVTFWHPSVSAASFDTSPWYDTTGNTVNLKDKNAIKSRFVVDDTDNIRDTVTGTVYTLNGSITHVNPAIATTGNTTGNGTLSKGADDIYENYNNPVHHPNKFYWYWPGGQAPKQVTMGTAVNGVTYCAGGIMATTEVADSPYLWVNFIPATPALSDSTTCKTYGGGPITTGETDHVAFRSTDYKTERDDIHSKKNPLQTLGGPAGQYSAYLHWQDSQTINIINSSITFQQMTDADAISVLQGHLSHGKQNANKYASGYNYFASTACVSNGGPKVILAIKSDGDNTVGYLLHDNKPGGEASTGDAYADWWGKSFTCAFGYDGLDDNPYVTLQTGWVTDGEGAVVTSLISGTDNASKTPDPSTPPIDLTGGTGGSGTSSGAPKLSCKASNGILGTVFSLNWILCPLIGGFTDIIGFVDNAITSQLLVGSNNGTGNPNKIFCNDKTCNAYHQAWASFRNISLGLLVIGGLVMLIAQVLGFEILDAYTLRKVAPRIFIVAIGITLSWQLMEFMVTLTNDLGLGVRNIIIYPFQSLGTDTIKLGGAGFATTLVGGIAAFSIGLVGLLALVASGALVLLMAFAVLVLRQIAIIMLLILAPVAIASYILPNTQKVYHIWWESFSKALLMFPIIAGLIAAGHAFSLVASQDTGTINQFAAFGAYFAPYFLVPATFKMAGGAIRQLGGFVNDRSRGAFDSLRGVRQRNSKKRREMYAHKFKTGEFAGIHTPSSRFNAASLRIAKATNRLGTGASAGWRGAYGFGERGKVLNAATLMEGAEASRKEKAMQKLASSNAFNRYMVLTAKHHGNEQKAMEDLRGWYASDRNEYGRKFEGEDLEGKLSEASAGMRAVGGFTAGRAVASYLNMGADKTAIKNLEDSGEIAAWVSEGNGSTAYELLSNVGSISKQGGRATLTASQDNRAALIGATMKRHWGDSTGSKVVGDYDEVVAKATMSGIGGESGYTKLLNSPSREIRSSVEEAFRVLDGYNPDDPNNTVSFETAAQAAATVTDLKNNVDMGYGTPDNKIEFNNAMNTPGRLQKLAEFMERPSEVPNNVPARASDIATRQERTVINQVPQKAGEYVRKLVGERNTQISQDQLAQMSAAEQARVQEQQQQQNDQQH